MRACAPNAVGARVFVRGLGLSATILLCRGVEDEEAYVERQHLERREFAM